MNYHQDKSYSFSQRSQASWKKPVMLVTLTLILYFWGSAILVDVSSFAVYSYLKISGQTEQNFSDALKVKKNLLIENKSLKADNTRLRAESLRLNSLQSENNQLRGLKDSGTEVANQVLGQIIIKPNHLPYDEIVIDIGKDRMPELKTGQLIFADKEVILGQIALVASSYSKVKLYSTSGVKIPVVVGESAFPSIAEGLGAGNFSLTLPRGANIKVGDKVKTSIVGSYILGYVAVISKDSNNPFQKIFFRSPYNIFELGWVQIKK